MITATQTIGLALASIVLIAVPGPSVMFVVGRAFSHGRTNALASVLGNAIGCFSVGVAIAFGLGPLLERSEVIFQIIKWAGILYLIYLGIHAIRHAAPSHEVNSKELNNTSVWAAIRTGTIVGLTNPKSFILFTAVVPQFIDTTSGNTPLQIVVLGLIPMLIGLITDSTWALSAGQARTWLAKSPQRMTTIGRIGGASIIGVGVSVALSDNHR
ncbi:LysE family transporter [Pseudarthrobacter psychrotolerans]|uniref:LysE family transporter n=1 Tax=Pseudarthrobacter psychrotolerans TaxID=2697569 RepID=A0A6P1NGK3_9MICC|nr:LysE family translocator [Pseudarthrobacter psychrotolerans]QHK18478.1 LysE family transporter [Pseudarthrobacter psychrotolerans]